MTLPSRRAFTLIELLVVILIIAVMAAVIIPAFAGYYDKSRFDSEVRRVQDYFGLAREKAVKGDTTVTLHFERGRHEFSIVVDAPPPQNDLPTAMLTAVPTAVQEIKPYQIADEYVVDYFNVTSSSSQAGVSQSDVHFNGDGTSDGADLELKSQQGYTAHLSLAAATGSLTLGAAQ